MTEGNSLPLSRTLWTTKSRVLRLKFDLIDLTHFMESRLIIRRKLASPISTKNERTDIFAFVCWCLSSVIGHFRSARLWPEARHPSRPLARPAATAAAAVDDFRASLSPPFKIEHPHHLSTFFPPLEKIQPFTEIFPDTTNYFNLNAINLTTINTKWS